MYISTLYSTRNKYSHQELEAPWTTDTNLIQWKKKSISIKKKRQQHSFACSMLQSFCKTEYYKLYLPLNNAFEIQYQKEEYSNFNVWPPWCKIHKANADQQGSEQQNDDCQTAAVSWCSNFVDSGRVGCPWGWDIWSFGEQSSAFELGFYLSVHKIWGEKSVNEAKEVCLFHK